MGSDHTLDLMIVDQLGNAEELLTLGAHRTGHIVGDEGQILGTASHQLLHDRPGLTAAAAHNGGAIGDHCRCLFGSDNRFLCHFSSSLFIFVL